MLDQTAVPLTDMLTLSDIITQYELAGGYPNQQQMIYDSCPVCPECNTQREFYKYLREVKVKPFSEKIDITFQSTGIIWGSLNIVLIILLVGAVFHKHVIDFVIDRWFPSKVKRRRKP